MGGRARIAGTRIRVTDVIDILSRPGSTPAELAAEFEVSLGEVYAALAYYHDHRTELEDERDAATRLVDEIRATDRGLAPPNSE